MSSVSAEALTSPLFFPAVESKAAVCRRLQDPDSPGKRRPSRSLHSHPEPVQETGQSDRGLSQGETVLREHAHTS